MASNRQIEVGLMRSMNTNAKDMFDILMKNYTPTTSDLINHIVTRISSNTDFNYSDDSIIIIKHFDYSDALSQLINKGSPMNQTTIINLLKHNKDYDRDLQLIMLGGCPIDISIYKYIYEESTDSTIYRKIFNFDKVEYKSDRILTQLLSHIISCIIYDNITIFNSILEIFVECLADETDEIKLKYQNEIYMNAFNTTFNITIIKKIEAAFKIRTIEALTIKCIISNNCRTITYDHDITKITPYIRIEPNMFNIITYLYKNIFTDKHITIIKTADFQKINNYIIIEEYINDFLMSDTYKESCLEVQSWLNSIMTM